MPPYRPMSTEAQESAKDARIAAIRIAVAEYMRSEGCSCCQDVEAHDIAKDKLGELLGFPRYDDDSGYDYRAVLKEQNPP